MAENQRRKPDVAGIILAAGQSSRMGAFKPLLPFGDSTVIDYCIQNLRDAEVETILVVVGHRAEELENHLVNASVSFAYNADPNSEMSSSIVYGVRALTDATKAAVILPVDYPAVSPAVISTLVEEWIKGGSLVVPSWSGKGGHPVLIDMSFRDELLALDTSRGLRSLFDTHRAEVTRLPVESPYIARDMDTWDDYASLYKDIFGRIPPKLPISGPKP